MRAWIGVALAGVVWVAGEAYGQSRAQLFTGNRSIGSEELLLLRKDGQSLEDLGKLVQEYYRSKGYVLAVVRVEGQSLVIDEGFLKDYEVSGNERTGREFVWQRVWGDYSRPFNVVELGERLQLLRNSPPFAEVRASVRPDGKLVIQVQEANQFSFSGSLSNSVPLTIGSERLSTVVGVNDLAVSGDSLLLGYNTTRTFGLNQFSIAYTAPVGENQTVALSFSPTAFRVTQPEFEQLGIRGSSQTYSLTYSNRLERSLLRETTLSVGFSRREGKTFIFDDIAVPFSAGVDPDGTTRTSNFNVGLNQLLRDTGGAWQWGLGLTLGTGLLGGTYNGLPNSSFAYVSANAQRLQVFDPALLGIFKFSGQFSLDPLFSTEQFSLGGSGSLRGYRASMRSGDNGMVLNNELRFIVDKQWQIYPFLDLGAVWNNPANPNKLSTAQNFLAGTGVGVLFEPSRNLNFNLELALPLLSTADRTTALQDFALYFNLGYRF